MTQLNKSFRDAVARAEKAEKESTELRKRLDDYKRAYNETKATLSKAQSDLQKSEADRGANGNGG